MRIQTTELPRRPALRYHGGKWRLAPWIVSHFPKHRVYVEPYGGAGSVLLQKPRSRGEIYNDLNPELVDFFCVLRDPKSANELERRLRLTPFARLEFRRSYEPTDCPIERSRRLVVRTAMAFATAGTNRDHRTGFRGTRDREGNTAAKEWATFPDVIALLTERLRGVCIENLPALKLIALRDGPDHLFYLDPTYLHPSRVSNAMDNYGEYEMSEADHCRLAEALHRIEGMAVISGYDTPLYRRLFSEWGRVEKSAYASANKGSKVRREILWLNPRCQEALR